MIVYAIKNSNKYVCLDKLGYIGCEQRHLTFDISDAYMCKTENEAAEWVKHLKSIDRSVYSRYSIVKVEIKEVK